MLMGVWLLGGELDTCILHAIYSEEAWDNPKKIFFSFICSPGNFFCETKISCFFFFSKLRLKFIKEKKRWIWSSLGKKKFHKYYIQNPYILR